MADEYQAEVCGSRWWNIPSGRSMFGGVSLSPCASAGITDFGWQHGDIFKLARSSTTTTTTDESGGGGGSASDGSVVIQDHIQKPPRPNQTDSGSLSMDSSLQILGIGLSSSSPSSTTEDWNRALLHGAGNNGRSETTNYPPMLVNYRQEAGMDEDEDNNSSSCPAAEEDWNHKNFSTAQCTSTTSGVEGLSAGFPISSVSSYGGYSSSTLLQNLFADDGAHNPHPQQSSLLYNNYQLMQQQANLNEFLPPELLISPRLMTNSSPLPKQSNNNTTCDLQFLNRNFCTSNNASSTLSNDFRPNNILFASQSQSSTTIVSDHKPNNLLKVTTGHGKPNNEDVQGMAVAKKSSSNEPTSFKRPRIETPSPLPTFKVRKEKLGDRITALQQLVSPFGKTDTASVLHEAIEYIKFLHDQVGVLSTPYLRNSGSPVVQQRQQTSDIKTKEQDLRSRGLCLVPISSTFPVAAETTTDFWTPTFGGTFR